MAHCRRQRSPEKSRSQACCFPLSPGWRKQNRIALAGIIVEDPAAANEVNRILHDFSQWIVGRMGIPYRSRGVSIISVVLDAPQPVLSSLSGKLGMVDGVSVKTVCSKANK